MTEYRSLELEEFPNTPPEDPIRASGVPTAGGVASFKQD